MTRYLLILALCCTLHAQERPRTVDAPFVALNAASLGAAAFDAAMTRRCIDSGTCHETNPLMKGSAGRMYGVALGTAAAGTFFSYEAKKHGSKTWMIAPLVSIGAHGFGAGMALRF
jgi:hypothetical protein